MHMDTDIELRHLRYFVAVAEELHFGRAAERLHLAQPPLSQQIRKLEELLGYPLFIRTSRSVSLTTAGEALLQRARRTLRNVQRDIDETRSIGRGDVGSLHIGFIGSAMLTTLPGIFRAYREAYPRVQLHLHESFTALCTRSGNGTLDAGILRDGDPFEGLQVTTILSEPFVAVLPSTHPSHGKRRSPLFRCVTIRSFTIRAAREHAPIGEPPLTLCEEHGFRPQIVQEASHWLTILRLIAAAGSSIAPVCARCIASAEVVCLPLRGAKAVSNIELAWLAGDSRPIVERFRQIAESTRRFVG